MHRPADDDTNRKSISVTAEETKNVTKEPPERAGLVFLLWLFGSLGRHRRSNGLAAVNHLITDTYPQTFNFDGSIGSI